MPTPRPAARLLFLRPLFARLTRNLRNGAGSLCSVIAAWPALFAEKTSRYYLWLRQAASTAGRFFRAAGAGARTSALIWRQCGLKAISAVRRNLIAIRRNLRAGLARILTAASSEVELPRVNLAPFFRVAVALFAIVAIAVAGFTAWRVIRSLPGTEQPAVIAAVEHLGPPGNAVAERSPPRATASAPDDLEADIVTLAGRSEDDIATPNPEAGNVAGATDIDAQGWYDITAGTEPEEEVIAALSPSPRFRGGPDISRPPAVSGIPIQPESPDGVAPAQPLWLANAVEPRRLGKGPMIAIVIDDAGVAQQRTARASELPAPLTLAFIPYSNNLERQARYARSRGHELLLHIPMEPGSPDADPGHNALLTSLSRDETMRRFRWALDRFDGYVGVNNHMGSKFMARGDLVQPVLEEINARGLLFLDSRTDQKTAGTRLARAMGIPHATRNVFLDNDLDAAKIRAQLAELERVARRHGNAIAIGHPHDVTTEVLAKWIPEARAKGFQLVPVSTIVKMEFGDEAPVLAKNTYHDGGVTQMAD